MTTITLPDFHSSNNDKEYANSNHHPIVERTHEFVQYIISKYICVPDNNKLDM